MNRTPSKYRRIGTYKPFLPDNFMNNKTKQRPKIIILSRLVYNPKKQDNS